MNTVLDYDILLQLLEPEQFIRLNSLQRQQVINAIAPTDDYTLKSSLRQAMRALAEHHRPIPGFKIH